MANQMPIYSQVVPKSQQGHNANFSRSSKTSNANRVYSSLRGDARQPHQLFDPLNYNQGGNFHLMSQPKDTRYAVLPSERVVLEKPVERRESGRRVGGSGHQSSRRGQHGQGSAAVGEGKVEAYLRQNQVSIRQHQYRHSSGVRQAEHRVNLRSLPLNEMVAPRAHHAPHERTPTDHHRQFPEHARYHRDRDGYCQQDAAALHSPVAAPMRKSNSGNRVSSSEAGQPTLNGDKRRFYCREWAFQKLAHCLEQRPVSKTCGALILGDAGSGKTALCKELSQPGPGPQARQQRALNRRLLARHFLQGQNENSLSMGELIRSVVMQILSHSTQHQTGTLALGLLNSPNEDKMSSGKDCNSPGDEELAGRLQDGQLCDDNEESSKPLLQDSEETRTDNEEDSGGGRRHRRTMQRIHERDKYDDLLAGSEVPNVMPKMLSTNPFLNSDDQIEDVHYRLYENHENIFLRNISHRQSKEIRNPRLLRQSSEPLSDKKVAVLQKSLSTENKSKSEGEQQNEQEQKEEKAKNADSATSPNEHLSPSNAGKVSRIPVANFRYPNRSGVSHSSSDNSPAKTKNSTSFDRNSPEIRKNDENVLRESPKPDMENIVDEMPEYQNVFKPKNLTNDFETLQIIQSPDCEIASSEKKWNEEVPPPIPSLPVSPRTLIANAYYEKLLGEPEIQQALLPHNLEKNPDDCFKKALLFPLLEIDPPKQCLFLLVDSIDEASLTGNGQVTTLPREGEKKAGEGERNTNSSKTVAELLANHHHLFPQWLLLVCTARKQSKSLTKMFTGFRKISLDELSRGHVSADVQRYVLARLDAEPRLRARVSADATAAAAAAAALDHMRIKSDGCLLYLEKVLDGVADGFIALREIKEIPGTLNGLYLWLAQRLFHGRRFAKLRPLLDVLLAAKCGVTEEMLYKCLLTTNYAITRDDFNKRLHLLRRVLVVEGSSGCLSVFHHSFASWLLDVKHCTRRYLCSPADGHAALAMYYTLEAKRLTALEIHNYVLHMTRLEQHILGLQNSKNAWKGDPKDENTIDVHTQILLWIIDSGCSVETALHHSIGRKDDEEMDGLVSSLYGRRLPRDTRVLRALLEVGAHVESGPLLPSDEAPSEDPQPPIADVTASQLSLERQLVWEARRGPPPEPPEPEAAAPDPLTGRTAAHELAQRDDARALEALLQRYPQLPRAADMCGATALHAAARHGAAESARVLLRAGALPDAADADGWTPLRAAAWGGHADVVEVLLEFGCQVDCVDADNRTALRAASWSGHDAVVRVLLAAGASADLADAEGRTPLIAAAYMGHADIVARLIDAGANVDHADHDGRTALSVAALCAPAAGGGCARAAQLLLERGADVKLADKDGATPLLVAAFEGHKEICELLLECDADAEACDAAGRTPLWAAAAAGHADAVRALLFWGCCVDSMDAEGRTVLSVAAAQGNEEVVRQLLDRGLDEHHRDNSGWTPLHYAAFEGHVEVCEALLEAGAKVDESDNDGKGALMLAAQEGHTRLIEVLIDDWGAPVDQHAHDGKTALRLAALEGHVDAVRALAERGAEVDAVDADRRSTLYVLALDNRTAMARYLLQRCQAAVDSRDTEGRTPLHVSAWQGHQDMVNLLITVGGAEVDARDRESRTALHAAAWRGRAGCVRALLQHGADPAARCSQGATPLGIAAQEGHEECVMWLLQHGADPLQPDHCGRTPGKVALRAGHASVCRLLERWAGRPDAPSAPPCAPTLDVDAATNTSGSTAETKACTAMLNVNRLSPLPGHSQGSPDCKRRSIHSSNSTKSSSNLTGSTKSSHHDVLQHAIIECAPPPPLHENNTDKSRAGLALSFAAQVARCGRGAGWRARGQGAASPLYASPPHSPLSDVCSPTQPVAGGLHTTEPPSMVSSTATDHHFNRDTHMRIILGRDSKSRQPPIAETRESGKTKRNGIVTNPAMRLVANVRNGLDSAAANIRRTGVALAASASSANPAVKTNAFQWRRETPL